MAQPAGSGISVLDGVALVAGAAVSSVQMRTMLVDDLLAPGWVMVLITFVWVAVTAAGPFLYIERKYVAGTPRYPRIGDRLWGVLGLPWVLSALIQTAPATAGQQAGTGTPGSFSALILILGTGISSLLALAVIWKTWVIVSTTQASDTFSPPWTNRLGLTLAIAWPIQWALVMVVMG